MKNGVELLRKREVEEQEEIDDELLQPTSVPLDLSVDRECVPSQTQLKHYRKRSFGSQQRSF